MKHRTAYSREEAFKIADGIITTDYDYDTEASANAGYPIFTSTADSANEWISDLNTRLEVNLADGHTVTIWIEEASEQNPTEDERRQAYTRYCEAMDYICSVQDRKPAKIDRATISEVYDCFGHCDLNNRPVFDIEGRTASGEYFHVWNVSVNRIEWR